MQAASGGNPTSVQVGEDRVVPHRSAEGGLAESL